MQQIEQVVRSSKMENFKNISLEMNTFNKSIPGVFKHKLVMYTMDEWGTCLDQYNDQ